MDGNIYPLIMLRAVDSMSLDHLMLKRRAW